MDVPMTTLVLAGAVVLALLLAWMFQRLFLRLFGVVLVPENHVAMVNKKYVLVGKNRTLPDGSVIALNGEAGWQADSLPPGVYFWLWPWQYAIEFQEFIEVKDGQLGIIDAIDGLPLTKGRVLAPGVECYAFQDARKFLTGGGQRGPQVSVLAPGVYRINTKLFNVRMAQATTVGVDEVGIVTVSDGRQLATESGEIAGPHVEGHNSFQDADAFMRAGGAKGLQEQVLLAGR